MNLPKRFFVTLLLTACLANVAVCYGQNASQIKSNNWETIVDSTSFSSYIAFESNWNYSYPWGNEHNGSARMYGAHGQNDQVSLHNNTLCITAINVPPTEGKSKHNPFQTIRYHSGAVYAKQQITVSEQFPMYEVSAFCQAPTGPGTWPALWLTAVKGWPPETDILEFKGDSINWQNTFILPKDCQTIKTALNDAASEWHKYGAILRKVSETDIEIDYFIDGKPTGTHRCNFMNKPMWLIINLQMEGSSNGAGPTADTKYFIKNLLVKRNSRL